MKDTFFCENVLFSWFFQSDDNLESTFVSTGGLYHTFRD